jgi:hypothetical protein
MMPQQPVIGTSATKSGDSRQDGGKSDAEYLLLGIGSQFDTGPMNSDSQISLFSPSFSADMQTTAVAAAELDGAGDAPLPKAGPGDGSKC